MGKTPAGRHLTVLPDDVFLTSYPRSGNTWIRFLVASLVHPEKSVSFANIEELSPSIHLHTNRWLVRCSRPRLLKSHEVYDRRYPKIIYVVRDPRDVAVSMYHYCIKRDYLSDSCPIDEFVPQFVAGEFFCEFGTWRTHVDSWLSQRRYPDRFLLVRYEDLLTNIVRELSRIAAFLGCAADDEMLKRAVEASSAPKMRSLEQRQAQDWVLTRGTRTDKAFVRKATSGEWVRVLSHDSACAIQTAWADTMNELGYNEICPAASKNCSHSMVKNGA